MCIAFLIYTLKFILQTMGVQPNQTKPQLFIKTKLNQFLIGLVIFQTKPNQLNNQNETKPNQL